MTTPRRIIFGAVLAAASFAGLHAQGRGGGEWTAAAFDAQRTNWVRSDARLTPDAVKKGQFAFLWTAKFDNESRQLDSLTTPILLDRLIGYRGFKALGFIGGSADRIFAIDTDLGRPYWTTNLPYLANTGGAPPSSWNCPGGLIATPSRRTTIVPPPAGPARGGGGRAGARNGSAVGEPGRGAAVLAQMAQQQAEQVGRGRGPGAPAAAPPAAPQGRGAPGAQPAAANGRNVTPIGFGGVDPVYVVGSDGVLHTLRSSDGADGEPPVPFLPPHTRPSSLIWGDGMVYAATSGGCGAAPNALWAIDLTAQGQKPVITWPTGGPDVAGDGPSFGTDGTLYVATGRGSGTYADAVVALDRFTLEVKDWFSAPGADFNVSPLVFRAKDRDLVAVTANDGRLYLLDAASLGGSDHKTPLHVTPKFSAAGAVGLATWEDQGTRWILAATTGAPQAGAAFKANGLAPNGSIVAFTLGDEGGRPTLAPAWRSRDLLSPLAPIVVNGMVFAASSGEYRPPAGGTRSTAEQRAQRSVPAVLYILDPASGKTLWTSGTTIKSFARAGLSAGGGQVYLVTYDNRLYAFGIPMEH